MLMRSGVTAINTKNRKQIANFLGMQGTGKLANSDCIEYDKLFKADYPFPVKTSIYKIISSVFITILAMLMIVAPIFRDWIGVVINSAFILISFIAFGFVRKIKYPNEQYSLASIIFASLISAALIVLSYFNREVMVSNLFFLEKLVGIGIVPTTEYDSLIKAMNIFFIVACALSWGCIIYGTVIGKRRFGTMITPLIVLGGIMIFSFIANISLSTDFLCKVYNMETGEERQYLLYLVLTASLLAMIAYDLIFIHIAKAIGGKEAKQR